MNNLSKTQFFDLAKRNEIVVDANIIDNTVAITAEDATFIFRIVVAGILSGIVGWLRLRRGSPAGYRTHAMIAVAAAAYTSIGVDKFPTETGRFVQGVITGIGFIGAGVIWQTTEQIKGLTTAAGMWVVAAIGVMVGLGEYFMGASLTVIVMVIQSLPDSKPRLR